MEQLTENLRASGFPEDWPLPPQVGEKTVAKLSREIYEFDLDRIHYSTEWRIESTDLEAAAAPWFESIPVSYIPAGFEESSGTESFGIFGDTKYIERLARNEVGFAVGVARVQTVNNLDTNQPEAIELKLEWEGPVDRTTSFSSMSVLADEELWDWTEQLPDLGLGSPVSSSVTIFAVDQYDPVTLSLDYEAGTDVDARRAVDRMRDPQVWTKGAVFGVSNLVPDDMEPEITFTLPQRSGEPVQGRIRIFDASDSSTATVRVVITQRSAESGN
jgi:hypothetical protein